MGSGLSGQSFSFHGYLPVDKNLCSSLIKKLEQESGRENRTQILIETPYRNAAIWQCLLTNLSPETRLCYAKDLSGSSEEIRQMTVAEWRKASAVTWVKMPVIFLFQK
jgi:16S rRNA (cytidine1402-2'-O)-methyltransferase